MAKDFGMSLDTVYRFLGNPNFNWRKLHLLFAKHAIDAVSGQKAARRFAHSLLMTHVLRGRTLLRQNLYQGCITMLTTGISEALVSLLWAGMTGKVSSP